jgi:hypothetical protein
MEKFESVKLLEELLDNMSSAELKTIWELVESMDYEGPFVDEVLDVTSNIVVSKYQQFYNAKVKENDNKYAIAA